MYYLSTSELNITVIKGCNDIIKQSHHFAQGIRIVVMSISANASFFANMGDFYHTAL